MTRALLLLTAIGLLAARSTFADEQKLAARDSLDGTWKLISVEINAQSLSMEKLQEARLTVKGAKYSLVLDDAQLEMTHVLHPDQQPKAMDLTIVEGPEKGKVFHAIYKLEGDTFTVCRNIKPDVDRPVDFSTKPDTGLILGVWKRQRPE